MVKLTHINPSFPGHSSDAIVEVTLDKASTWDTRDGFLNFKDADGLLVASFQQSAVVSVLLL